MIRGWDPIIPVWRWLYSQAPANQQSFGGVGVSTTCGAVSTRGITVVHVWKDLWSEDGTPLSPANVGFILEPQAISNRSVGFGFPHRARRCRPGGSPSSSASCRSCRYKEGLLGRGWGPLLPGCVGIVGFPRGATPAARAAPPQRPRAGRGGAPRPIGFGLGKRWHKSHLPVVLYTRWCCCHAELAGGARCYFCDAIVVVDAAHSLGWLSFRYDIILFDRKQIWDLTHGEILTTYTYLHISTRQASRSQKYMRARRRRGPSFVLQAQR